MQREWNRETEGEGRDTAKEGGDISSESGTGESRGKAEGENGKGKRERNKREAGSVEQAQETRGCQGHKRATEDERRGGGSQRERLRVEGRETEAGRRREGRAGDQNVPR